MYQVHGPIPASINFISINVPSVSHYLVGNSEINVNDPKLVI